MFGLYRQHAAAQLLPQKQQRELQGEGGGPCSEIPDGLNLLHLETNWMCFLLEREPHKLGAVLQEPVRPPVLSAGEKAER